MSPESGEPVGGDVAATAGWSSRFLLSTMQFKKSPAMWTSCATSRFPNPKVVSKSPLDESFVATRVGDRRTSAVFSGDNVTINV